MENYLSKKTYCQCDVCDSSKSEIFCSDCQNAHNFCKCCFDLAHRSPTKKSHKPKLLTKTSSTSLMANTHLYKCAQHPFESKKYICLECGIPVCADCLVIGEHNGHTPKGFEDSIANLIGQLSNNLKENEIVLARTKELSWMLNEERNIEKTAFLAYSNGITEKFKSIKEQLMKKMNDMVLSINNEAERVDKLLENLINGTSQIQQNLESKMHENKALFEQIKNNSNPENYVDFSNQVNNLTVDLSIHEKLFEYKNAMDKYEKIKIPPIINLENIQKAVKNIDFIENEKLIIEAQYNVLNKEIKFLFKKLTSEENGIWIDVKDCDTGKIIGESCLINRIAKFKGYTMNSENKKFRVSLGIPWNYTTVDLYKKLPEISFEKAKIKFNKKYDVPVNDISGIYKDFITSYFYYIKAGDNTEIYKYKNLQDLIEGKSIACIYLEYPINSLNICIKNNLLYYNIGKSNNLIGIADLLSGKILEMANIPYCETSDLWVTYDEKLKKIYVAYQVKNEFRITEIQESKNTKLTLGQTWGIRGIEKCNFNSVIILNGIAYFTSKNYFIQEIYNLELCKRIKAEKIEIPSENIMKIRNCNLLPYENCLILYTEDPYRILIYEITF